MQPLELRSYPSGQSGPSHRLGAAMVLTLVLGLVGGIALDRLGVIGLPPPGTSAGFRLISEAWGLIDRFYVDRAAVQPHALTYGAISGMVDALGDTGHSRFLSPTMVKEMNELERSKYQGIGAEVRLKAGHVVIAVPFDGSPAQRAGLVAGDIILQVNGQDVTGVPVDQVVERISGPAGTSVTLTILAPKSGQTSRVTVTRATIRINNVTWQMLPGTKIIHLRVASCSDGVATDLRNSLTKIKSESPAGLILDLRNNPGGILEEAIGVASQFLKQGNVLLVKNARGREEPVPVKAGGEATEIPLMALINNGTASGAEIVAAALQDAHRAQLMGETTFGTGTVLDQFNLSDGSALLLAIEEWLTPAGHVIWHKGIMPDVVVPLAQGVSPVFPEAEHAMSDEQLRNSRDAQLLRALELLGEVN